MCAYLHIKGVGVKQTGSNMNFFLKYYAVTVIQRLIWINKQFKIVLEVIALFPESFHFLKKVVQITASQLRN